MLMRPVRRQSLRDGRKGAGGGVGRRGGTAVIPGDPDVETGESLRQPGLRAFMQTHHALAGALQDLATCFARGFDGCPSRCLGGENGRRGRLLGFEHAIDCVGHRAVWFGYWHRRGKCIATAARLCLTLGRAMQILSPTLGRRHATRIGSSA